MSRPSALTPDEIREHVRRIEERGYTRVENVLAPEEADIIAAALARAERERTAVPADNDFEGRRTVRVYNLLAHDRVFEQIPVHRDILPIVEGVLDSGCLISSLSSIAIGPGESAQMLHADDQLIPLPRPHPAIVCNTMWALSDFSEENGATRVVPGSHMWDHSPDPTGKHEGVEVICASMKRGSVLVWNGSLWHGGGANRTNRTRIGIAMNYCAGFIRQQENQQLGIPREVARGFSPRLKRLVGYGVYRSLIGHIDKRDPIELLGEDGELRTVWDRPQTRRP